LRKNNTASLVGATSRSGGGENEWLRMGDRERERERER